MNDTTKLSEITLAAPAKIAPETNPMPPKGFRFDGKRKGPRHQKPKRR